MYVCVFMRKVGSMYIVYIYMHSVDTEEIGHDFRGIV